jgi:hypothetical protein
MFIFYCVIYNGKEMKQHECSTTEHLNNAQSDNGFLCNGQSDVEEK